jgi:lysophospholipase L1-like esterase
MRFRWLTIGLAAVLLAAPVAFWWTSGGRGESVHGMSDSPCTPSGKPVSGEDWAQLCVYRAANAQLIERGDFPEVVMIGDSITQGWPLPEEGYANRGIGGQISGQVLLRFRQDAIMLKPEIIHILAGINDVTGISSMVELAQYHRIPVILGTIGPAQDVPERPQVDRRKRVPAINRWLAQFARDSGVILADYHAVLAHDDGSMRKELFADTVHPNSAGYAAMEKVMLEAVEQARETSRPAPSAADRPG